jgi:hypothetical protein
MSVLFFAINSDCASTRSPQINADSMYALYERELPTLFDHLEIPAYFLQLHTSDSVKPSCSDTLKFYEFAKLYSTSIRSVYCLTDGRYLLTIIDQFNTIERKWFQLYVHNTYGKDFFPVFVRDGFSIDTSYSTFSHKVERGYFIKRSIKVFYSLSAKEYSNYLPKCGVNLADKTYSVFRIKSVESSR